MPSVFKRRENIREKQRKSENFREFQRTLEKAFLKSIDARGVLPTFAPIEETRQRLEGFWLILNHHRIFYYAYKINACGAAGRGLRCAESEE